jgi:DegV family protein with EDD domain
VPKTSQPTPEEFVEAYGKLADEGVDEIVSLHISAELSGTLQSAYVASQTSRVPVRLVDSRVASLGTGLMLARLVAARDDGATGEELERIVAGLVPRVRLMYTVDSLKWLEIGGRIGKASALLGGLLSIRPILTVTDGFVAPLKKVKGAKRVIEEMIAQVVAEGGTEKPTRGVILRADSTESSDALQAGLAAAGVKMDYLLEGRIGCVIGTYLGPGAYGVIYERNDV